MIRLYLDEDTLSTAFVRALQNADLDVLTVAQADRLGMPDEAQLLWATECQRVLYSFNVGDFCRLHRDFLAQGRTHGGIILAAQRKYPIGQQVRGLLKIAAEQSSESMSNQILFLSRYVS
jgi:Domain of unknown function (DUF5615)